MHRLRQRSVSARVLWALLLLLAVVLKPVLVLASETHESGHAVQTGHAHDALEDAHHVPVDEATGAADADPWHSLMHLGQCCSHPSAASVACLEVGRVISSTAPDVPRLHQRSDAGLTQPLRPPIRA